MRHLGDRFQHSVPPVIDGASQCNMATEPRIHHHIPQAYLRGFGWKKGKNWYVYAADLKACRYIQPNTKNICAERDFLRVDLEGLPPYKLEKEMAKFEAQAREAILHIAAARKFEGDDRLTVLNLMALLAVRSPQMRENMRDFQERLMKMTMGVVLAKKERWEAQIQRMRVAGQAPEDQLSYEQVKRFHNEDQYTIEVPRELHIGAEFKVFDPVLRTLIARKWRLYYASEAQGHFVTSDHPVVLTWNHPESVPPMVRDSPGFGMQDTEVVFPLTSECFLLGRFEGMEDGVEEAYAPFIAHCNTRVTSHAFDYAIMSEKAFPYVMPPDQIHWDDKFMERAREYRDSRPPNEEDECDWSAEEDPTMPKPMPMDAGKAQE